MTGARDITLTGYVLRVVRRPWPWVLRYLLATVPALVLAPLIALPLRSWFRLPLLVEALNTRSLDLLIEVLVHPPAGTSLAPWLVLALLLAFLLWAIVGLLVLWTEGGVLASYVGPVRLSWREFAGASTRWFGSLLLLALLGTGLTVVCVGGIAGLAWLAQTVSRPVGIVVSVIGLAAAGVVRVEMQMARACVVVGEDRNVLRALREAWHTMLRRPLPLLALVIGALALRGLLAYGSGALIAHVPLSWWLLSLVIQQPVQMLVVGIGLARRAGEIGIAAAVLVQDAADG